MGRIGRGDMTTTPVLMMHPVEFKTPELSLASIKRQTIETSVCSVIYGSTKTRPHDEPAGRSLLQTAARSYEAGYVVMQDHHLVLLYDNTYQKMSEHLDRCPEYGALILSSGHPYDTSHKRITCGMYRSELFQNIKFMWGESGCVCDSVVSSIEESGYKIDYLDMIERYRKIPIPTKKS